VDCLLRCEKVEKKKGTRAIQKLKPCLPGAQGEMKTIPILLHCVADISQIRLHIEKDMKSSVNRNYIGSVLAEVQRRYQKDGVPLLDPVDDMKIKDPAFLKLIRKAESLEDRLKACSLRQGNESKKQCEQYEKSLDITNKINTLTKEIKNVSNDVELRRTLHRMKRVLRGLGMTSKNDIVDVKGRFACELSSCDEIVGTELMFSGIFTNLSVNHIVALCSCLVLDKPTLEKKIVLPSEMIDMYQRLREITTRVAEVMKDAKMPVDVNDYVNSFRCELMHVVYAWCEGAQFQKICKMTTMFEGNIIRIMRRLHEVLIEFASASRAIGNESLEKKFLAGQEKLKRDIVFAASLYL